MDGFLDGRIGIAGLEFNTHISPLQLNQRTYDIDAHAALTATEGTENDQNYTNTNTHDIHTSNNNYIKDNNTNTIFNNDEKDGDNKSRHSRYSENKSNGHINRLALGDRLLLLG